MSLSKIIFCFVQNRRMITMFGLIGAITFILNYLFVWLLYGVFILDYRLAVTIAFIITTATHFMLNRTFTYRANRALIVHHAWKYGITLIISYIFNLSISIVTVEVFRLTPYFGVVFATVAMMGLSFFMMKYFVFSCKVHKK